MRYRLTRLRELFGDALEDPEARFELELALRARTVDGRLEVTSPPGGPTQVTIELPLHA